jgi:hypothetical protein
MGTHDAAIRPQKTPYTVIATFQHLNLQAVRPGGFIHKNGEKSSNHARSRTRKKRDDG